MARRPPKRTTRNERFQAYPDRSVELYFGPNPPVGREAFWIKTLPGKGWFTYFHLYGPQAPAFDATWSLPDLGLVNDQYAGVR